MQVLELMKKCISSTPNYGKMGEIIRNVLFSDSSIHNTLFQVVCTTSHALEVTYVKTSWVYYSIHLFAYFTYSYV